MITIEQEKRIRKLLAAGGLSNNKIAVKANVSRHAVKFVKNTMSIVGKIPEEKQLEVKKLLMAGYPVPSIEVNAKIPKSHIIAIRRFFFLTKRRFEGNINHCPTCGSVILKKSKFKSLTIRPLNIHRLKIDDLEEMYRIVCDVYHLGELSIISNPLFHRLAKQSEKYLERTNDQSETI